MRRKEGRVVRWRAGQGCTIFGTCLGSGSRLSLSALAYHAPPRCALLTAFLSSAAVPKTSSACATTARCVPTASFSASTGQTHPAAHSASIRTARSCTRAAMGWPASSTPSHSRRDRCSTSGRSRSSSPRWPSSCSRRTASSRSTTRSGNTSRRCRHADKITIARASILAACYLYTMRGRQADSSREHDRRAARHHALVSPLRDRLRSTLYTNSGWSAPQDVSSSPATLASVRRERIFRPLGSRHALPRMPRPIIPNGAAGYAPELAAGVRVARSTYDGAIRGRSRCTPRRGFGRGSQHDAATSLARIIEALRRRRTERRCQRGRTTQRSARLVSEPLRGLRMSLTAGLGGLSRTLLRLPTSARRRDVLHPPLRSV